MTDTSNHNVLDSNYQPIDTREYVYTRSDSSKIIIQDHSAGHTFKEGGIGDQGPHFNVRPYADDPADYRNGVVEGTLEHHLYDK